MICSGIFPLPKLVDYTAQVTAFAYYFVDYVFLRDNTAQQIEPS